MGNEIQKVNNGLDRTRRLLDDIGLDRTNPNRVSKPQISEKVWNREIPNRKNSEVGFSNPLTSGDYARFTDPGLLLLKIEKLPASSEEKALALTGVIQICLNNSEAAIQSGNPEGIQRCRNTFNRAMSILSREYSADYIASLAI